MSRSEQSVEDPIAIGCDATWFHSSNTAWFKKNVLNIVRINKLKSLIPSKGLRSCFQLFKPFKLLELLKLCLAVK